MFICKHMPVNDNYFVFKQITLEETVYRENFVTRFNFPPFALGQKGEFKTGLI